MKAHCAVIIVQKYGITYNTEVIVGPDEQAVVEAAEKEFVEQAQLHDDNFHEHFNDDDLKDALVKGSLEFGSGMSVTLTWANHYKEV